MAIYKNRIEIYNPGTFPEGFEPEDFIDRPERPIRRNPKIARILYYSKDIESFGTGLKRIVDACNGAGVKYEFKKMKSGFVVCFYRLGEKAEKEPIKAEKEPIKAEKEPIKAEKEPIKAEKNQIKTDRREMIIRYILEKGFITNKEAREILGLADSTTKRILKEMADENVLVAEGERKARKYYLSKI